VPSQWCAAIAQIFYSESRILQQSRITVMTMNAERFQNDFDAILQQFCSGCTAIEKRLRSDCTAIAQRLHIDCAAITKRLQIDRTAIVKRLQIDFGATAQQFRSDYSLIVMQSHSPPIDINPFFTTPHPLTPTLFHTPTLTLFHTPTLAADRSDEYNATVARQAMAHLAGNYKFK
jgi:hypothetical protein